MTLALSQGRRMLFGNDLSRTAVVFSAARSALAVALLAGPLLPLIGCSGQPDQVVLPEPGSVPPPSREPGVTPDPSKLKRVKID